METPGSSFRVRNSATEMDEVWDVFERAAAFPDFGTFHGGLSVWGSIRNPLPVLASAGFILLQGKLTWKMDLLSHPTGGFSF